jgi:hypothetical protein
MLIILKTCHGCSSSTPMLRIPDAYALDIYLALCLVLSITQDRGGDLRMVDCLSSSLHHRLLERRPERAH